MKYEFWNEGKKVESREEATEIFIPYYPTQSFQDFWQDQGCDFFGWAVLINLSTRELTVLNAGEPVNATLEPFEEHQILTVLKHLNL